MGDGSSTVEEPSLNRRRTVPHAFGSPAAVLKNAAIIARLHAVFGWKVPAPIPEVTLFSAAQSTDSLYHAP